MKLNQEPNLLGAVALAAGTGSAQEMQVVKIGYVAPTSGAQN